MFQCPYEDYICTEVTCVGYRSTECPRYQKPILPKTHEFQRPMNHPNCTAPTECTFFRGTKDEYYCGRFGGMEPCAHYHPNLSGSENETKKDRVFFGHPDFYKILDELKELHSRKNQDYAGENPLSNLEMCEKGGIPPWKGVIVRLTDKISRLLTFSQKEEFQVKDESVEDTFEDLAVYAILGLILYRESKAKR